ncbi:DUF2182 domain-containing protein [Catellatospora chokoriensis]|uniref:DUF2182 domain-containing protein n=1 Tax=Catellatospora chokoriensis TaxID=310353 RepID=A0A8J3KAW0_9ACTN|nr:DUF2182 domain-containing protein [Catellatospora chokoriensis]GIF91764.1 hypothetical protein Cch02nite_52080 [Catellatospora chokoriensis]
MRLRHAVTAATLGLAVAGWVLMIWLMDGMDMGPATPLGPFAIFVAGWASMIAAMMLPGTVPAVVRRARAGAGMAALFVAAYLGVWTLVGVAVFALYRPHGPAAAGVLVIAAGGYELTPVKRHFRRRCGESGHSGFGYGLHCVGSSIGLMLVLVAVGLMNIGWMCVITALCLAQKLLPARAAVDVPLALAVVALGLVLLTAPEVVPGLHPPPSPLDGGGHHHSHH